MSRNNNRLSSNDAVNDVDGIVRVVGGVKYLSHINFTTRLYVWPKNALDLR
jgi:hypothetical protein